MKWLTLEDRRLPAAILDARRNMTTALCMPDHMTGQEREEAAQALLDIEAVADQLRARIAPHWAPRPTETP